jgi:hypothetical protein
VCENYRGITLLSVAYEILSGILNGRLKVFVENIFGEYQCGFHPHGSTIDQVFIIRQMLEKFYEYDTGIGRLFIDFKQAFNSIRREELYKVRLRMETSIKIIKLV